MDQIIVFAIPVFALLIGLEFAYGWLKGRNTYRLNDAISSLSQGLLSQVAAVCTQIFQIGLYAMFYAHFGPKQWAAAWQTPWGWVAAVVFFDFCDYWLHRVSHRSAIFWAAHIVHHQSQCFNFSTALRQESAYAVLGWMFYLPMALAGVPPTVYAVAGLVVLLYQFWIHTELVGRLGWFDRVFSSPSNHRVHHAVNDRYIDKNYGAIFVLWDRLFGTFEPETEPCVYGTRTPLNSWDPGWTVLQGYWSLLSHAMSLPRWRDRARALWAPPGWHPQVSRSEPFDPSGIRPYDPPMTAPQQWAGSALFALAVIATALFLWHADDLTTGRTACGALSLVLALWGIGRILKSPERLVHAGLLSGAASGLAIAISAGTL